MGVISVAGPQFGQRYNVNILGETPTPEEQEKINQFVVEQEASLAQRVEDRFSAPAQEQIVQEVEDEDPKGGFVNAMGVGLDALQVAYGNTLERIGANTGIAGLQDYGTSVIEANEQQIAEKSEGADAP